MTRLLTILAVVGILAVALWVPAQAGMVAVGDTDLAAISGKAITCNTYQRTSVFSPMS